MSTHAQVWGAMRLLRHALAHGLAPTRVHTTTPGLERLHEPDTSHRRRQRCHGRGADRAHSKRRRPRRAGARARPGRKEEWVYVGGVVEVGGAGGGCKQGHGGKEREGQEAVLTQASVREQGYHDTNGRCTKQYKHCHETALMLALRMGKKGMMEKLFAAGAKVEATDEVHGRRGWWAGDVW